MRNQEWRIGSAVYGKMRKRIPKIKFIYPPLRLSTPRILASARK
jgi:hypothetical protein